MAVHQSETSSRDAGSGPPCSPAGTEAVLPPTSDVPSAPSGRGAFAGVVAFRRAAVAVAANPPESDNARLQARLAGEALVALGAAGDEDSLRTILTPDPGGDGRATTWTVACYQFGDLNPSALRDFADATTAVATLARCEDRSHVAAELLASTPTGVRWAALIRTGESVAFQLLTAATGNDASTPDPGRLDAARRQWEDRLQDWAAHPERGDQHPPPVPDVRGPSAVELGLALGQVLEAVRAVEHRVEVGVGTSEVILGAVAGRRLRDPVPASGGCAGQVSPFYASREP